MFAYPSSCVRESQYGNQSPKGPRLPSLDHRQLRLPATSTWVFTEECKHPGALEILVEVSDGGSSPGVASGTVGGVCGDKASVSVLHRLSWDTILPLFCLLCFLPVLFSSLPNHSVNWLTSIKFLFCLNLQSYCLWHQEPWLWDQKVRTRSSTVPLCPRMIRLWGLWIAQEIEMCD